MIEENIFEFISKVGFPAAICFWFMFRTEKVIKSNTEAMNRITGIIRKCPAKRNI